MAACIHCGADVTVGSRFCASCGQPATPSGATGLRRPSEASLASGEQRLLETLRAATLGEYEVLGEIGRGGMAIVFLAYDIALERKVAIKLMSPALLLMDPAIQARFKREARTAAALSHPHIIPVYAVKESDDLVYFVMKYIEGRSLEAVIEETGPLPTAAAVTILQQAGGALAYAHRKGVVHRDVKPGNIMLDEAGWVVVSDFGIAKVAQREALTVTGGVVGTPAYMSPEQCQGLDIGGATDQYALGILAYEMLTGRPPFQGETMVNLIYDHCHTPPISITDLRPDCPPDLAAVIMRMLAKQPEDRFPSIEEAVAAAGTVGDSADETRTQLLTFVQQTPSTSEQLIDKFRTPAQPMTPAPPSAAPLTTPAGAPPTAQPTPATAAPIATPPAAPAKRWAFIGVPAAAILAVFGWFMLNGPAEETAPPTRPAEQATMAPAGPTASEVEISPTSVQVPVGGQTALVAVARDSTGQPVVGPLTWESRDPDVASVTDGAVTGLASGSARVVARSGLSSAAVTVEVVAPPPASSAAAGPRPTRVTIDPGTVTIGVGDRAALTGRVLDQRGQSMAGARIAWRSTAPEVASVGSDGQVTGVRAGMATVVGSAAGLSATAQIMVTTAPVAGVDVAPGSVTLRPGESSQLRASVRDDRGGAVTDRAVTWSTSNPAVAQVSPSGLVRGVAAGSARVTAGTDGVTATVAVTVEAAPAAAPAPQPVADPRPLILAEVERYRQAISSADIDRLRDVDPSMSADRQRAWEQFFENVSDLTARFDNVDLDVGGDRATARVSATYEFRAGQSQTQQTTLTIQLRRASGQWRIQSVE
jgi:serine/threonine-protein kinase